MAKARKAFVFKFVKPNGDVVEFGPHRTERMAMEAYQWRYGYWPMPAIEKKEYVISSSID